MTAGPGLTNTVTAVKNAQVAQSPLLLLGGAASTLLQVCSSCGGGYRGPQGDSKGSHGNCPTPSLPETGCAPGHGSHVLIPAALQVLCICAEGAGHCTHPESCNGCRAVRHPRYEGQVLGTDQALGPRCWGRCHRLGILPVPSGPVFVELPLDVQYPYFMVEKEMLPVNLPRGLVGRVVFW